MENSREEVNGFVLKFVDDKFVENVRHGNFFCNSLEYFRKVEEGEKIGIKDPDEGRNIKHLNPITNVFMMRRLGDSSRPIVLSGIKGAKFTIDYSLSAKIKICCFAFLDFEKDFERTDDETLVIKESVLTQLRKDFPNRKAILISAPVFAEEMQSIKISDYPQIGYMEYGFVRYQEGFTDIQEDDFNLSPQQVLDVAFNKEPRFKNQHEFRLGFLAKNEGPLFVKGNDFYNKVAVIDDISVLKDVEFHFEF